jgi:hypothetical protein
MPQLYVWVVRYSPFFGSLKNWNNLSKNNWLHDIILILLIRELIFVGWCFSFLIVLVCRYKLSSYQTWFTWLSGNYCLCVWVVWSWGSHHLLFNLKTRKQIWNSELAQIWKQENKKKTLICFCRRKLNKGKLDQINSKLAQIWYYD